MTRTLWGILLLAASAVFACEENPPKAEPAAPPSALAPNPVPAPAPPEPEPAPTPTKPPESVAAQHVLITYRGAKNAPKEVKRTKAAAKTLAEEVAAKAKGGTDFTALVKEYSEDPGTKDRLGSLGKFTPDKMVKPFSDAAFHLGVDEVSAPVETEFGFHIIKRNQ